MFTVEQLTKAQDRAVKGRTITDPQLKLKILKNLLNSGVLKFIEDVWDGRIPGTDIAYELQSYVMRNRQEFIEFVRFFPLLAIDLKLQVRLATDSPNAYIYIVNRFLDTYQNRPIKKKGPVISNKALKIMIHNSSTRRILSRRLFKQMRQLEQRLNYPLRG